MNCGIGENSVMYIILMNFRKPRFCRSLIVASREIDTNRHIGISSTSHNALLYTNFTYADKNGEPLSLNHSITYTHRWKIRNTQQSVFTALATGLKLVDRRT